MQFQLSEFLILIGMREGWVIEVSEYVLLLLLELREKKEKLAKWTSYLKKKKGKDVFHLILKNVN